MSRTVRRFSEKWVSRKEYSEYIQQTCEQAINLRSAYERMKRYLNIALAAVLGAAAGLMIALVTRANWIVLLCGFLLGAGISAVAAFTYAEYWIDKVCSMNGK